MPHPRGIDIVSQDAVQLSAELVRYFVLGMVQSPRPVPCSPPFLFIEFTNPFLAHRWNYPSTTEAGYRASIVAKSEGLVTVEPNHLEKVLPQLVSLCVRWQGGCGSTSEAS